MAWPMPMVTSPPVQRYICGTRPSKRSTRGMTLHGFMSVDQRITDKEGRVTGGGAPVGTASVSFARLSNTRMDRHTSRPTEAELHVRKSYAGDCDNARS